MLQTVDVGERSLRTYRAVAPEPILDELARRAEGLRGARVLHVNATAYGGGVSELLRSIVPLLNDLGLVADWQVIGGDDEFFNVTKAMHNALQGVDTAPDSGQRQRYNAERNAAELAGQQFDFVFVHDPQPAALLSLLGRGDAPCSVDPTDCRRGVPARPSRRALASGIVRGRGGGSHRTGQASLPSLRSPTIRRTY